jgi:hypothetical protein
MTMRRLLLTLPLLLPTALWAEEWLDSAALSAMVSDKTAVCRHISRPSSGRTYYDPDGSMHGIRRGKTRIGRWYVEGDTLCTDWGKRAICSRYTRDGAGGHYKYTRKGKRTVHISKWLAGDRVFE